MTFECIKEDISIAEKALKDSKLDVAVSGYELLCEVYCLTPFHWQSFYLRIFDGDEYILQYAKPYIKNYYQDEIVSVPFKYALKAETHVACEGKIICGLKKLKKDNSTINTLLDCMPVKNEIHNSLMTDGTLTAVINRKINPPIALCFKTGESFSENSYTNENTEFLHDLFLIIEEIIGNSATRDKSYLCMQEMYCEQKSPVRRPIE